MIFLRFFKKQSIDQALAASSASRGKKGEKFSFFFGRRKVEAESAMSVEERIKALFYSGAELFETKRSARTVADPAERPISGTAEQDSRLSEQLDLIEREGGAGSDDEKQTLLPDEDVPDMETLFAGQRSELLQKIEEASLASGRADPLLPQAPAPGIEELGGADAPQTEISLWQEALVEGSVLESEKPGKGGSAPGVLADSGEEEGLIIPLTPLKSDQAETVYWRENSADTVEGQDIRLSFEDYGARLARLDREQRKKLAQAAHLGINQNSLQRELVVIDGRVTLLHDSYEEEIRCLQRALLYLETLPERQSDARLARAIEDLKEGRAEEAENYLTEKSQAPSSFAATAYYCGQLAERRADLVKALEMYRRALTRQPDELPFLLAAGATARILYRHDEALSWLSRYARLLEGVRQEDPLLWAQAQRELAYTHVLRGQYKEAGPLYKLSMITLARQLGQNNPEMADSWYQIGEFQESLGEYEKAMILYKKALYIFEKNYGPFHPRLIAALDRLGSLCMELELAQEAVYFYKRKVFIQKKALRPDHPQLALSLDRLAEGYRLQSQYTKAEACYQQSLLINKVVYGATHPSVAVVYQELAKLCAKQNKPEEATNYQQQATAIFRKQLVDREGNSGSRRTLLVDIPSF